MILYFVKYLVFDKNTFEDKTKELKIGFFGRFIGEKLVFGWHGNDFNKIKSKEKKSAKNREKSPIFCRKIERENSFAD